MDKLINIFLQLSILSIITIYPVALNSNELKGFNKIISLFDSRKSIDEQFIKSDNIRLNGNTISAQDTNGSVNINPDGTGSVVLGGEIVGVTNELNATDIEVSNVLRANKIQSDTSDTDITISSQGTGAVAISSQLTLTGSFKPAIHTFTATDAITEIEHAGRTLVLNAADAGSTSCRCPGSAVRGGPGRTAHVSWDGGCDGPVLL